jgi:hypothetical protein
MRTRLKFVVKLIVIAGFSRIALDEGGGQTAGPT